MPLGMDTEQRSSRLEQLGVTEGNFFADTKLQNHKPWLVLGHRHHFSLDGQLGEHGRFGGQNEVG